MRSEIVIGLPDYEISEIELKSGEVRISARYAGAKLCPYCGKDQLRNKGAYQRQVRHENWGLRHGVLELRANKWQCKSCKRYFRERFPGILPCQRSSEAFQQMIFRDHRDGINRSRLGRREGIGAATVERYFRRGLAARGRIPLSETARNAGVNLIPLKNCERKCSAPFQTALHALWIVKTADRRTVRALVRPWGCRGLPQPLNFRSSNPMLNPAACTSTRFITLSVPRTWHRRIAPVS